MEGLKRAAVVSGCVAASLVGVLGLAAAAGAQAAPSAPTSQPVTTMLALGALTVVPLLFMVTTSFVKIAVVFSIPRNALGTRGCHAAR